MRRDDCRTRFEPATTPLARARFSPGLSASRAAVGLSLGMLVLVGAIVGQARGQLGAIRSPSGLLLEEAHGETVLNSKLARRLDGARSALEQGDVQTGIVRLRELLEGGEDAFRVEAVSSTRRPARDPAGLDVPAVPPIPDDRPNGAGENEAAGVAVSLLREADRLLANLSDEGHRAYELQYGGAAREALAEGRGVSALQEVARRYAHTVAGTEAAMRCAEMAWEAGHLDTARAGYERLLDQPRSVRRLGMPLVVRGAVAAWLSGDAARGVALLSSLKGTNGQMTWRGEALAAETVAADPSTWLTQEFGPVGEGARGALTGGERTVEDWRVVGGDSRRSAGAEGAAPYLGTSSWSADLVRHSTATDEGDAALRGYADAYLRQYLRRMVPAGVVLLPAARPIVSGNRIVTRGFGQIVAHNLVDGGFAWRGSIPDALMTQVLGESPVVDGAGLSQVLPALQDKAWFDQTTGTLSADEERVYALEPVARFDTPTVMFANQNAPLREENRLAAYDLGSGKLRWRLGGPVNGADEFSGVTFLGVPLPHEGRLYTIAEFADEVRLMVLESQTGKVAWSQRLVKLDIAVGADLHHQRRGVSPSLAGSVLVCPTDAGRIVAVDITARTLLWEYLYRSDTPVVNNGPRLMIPPLNGPEGLRDSALQDRWTDGLAMIDGARVVISPRGCDSLRCLDLATGQLLWTHPRKDGLFVGCVAEGVALVVGRSSLRGVRLADGRPAWEGIDELPIPAPSGRGYLATGRYHLPLSSAELLTLDVATGRELARVKTPEGVPLGNLVAARGTVVSQRVDTLSAYHDIERLERTIAESLEKTPDDGRLLTVRGQLLLHKGDGPGAQRAFRRAMDVASSDEQVRAGVVTGMLELLRTDFATYRDSMDDVEKLLATDADRMRFHRTVSEGYAAAGDTAASLKALLRLAEVDLLPRGFDDMGEGGWRVRADAMIAGRVRDLLDSAKEEDRSQLEGLVRERWSQLKESRRPEELRRFVALFGATREADEARSALARLLVAQGERLEIETLLLDLLSRSDEAAQRRELLPQLYDVVMSTGRARDGWRVLRDIAARYPDLTLPSGESALTEFVAWRLEDPRGEDSPPFQWPAGTPKVSRVPVPPPFGGTGQPVRIPFEGDPGPWLADLTLSFDVPGRQLVAMTPERQEAWRAQLLDVEIEQHTARAWGLGHLVVLFDGRGFTAIDTAGTTDRPFSRVLWTETFGRQLGTTNPSSEPPLHTIALPTGRVVVTRVDRDGRPFQSVRGVSTRYFAFRWGDRLTVVDPLTGEERWSRRGIAGGSVLGGDDEWLTCQAEQGTTARRFRLCDGKEFPAVAVPPAARIRASREGIVAHVADGKVVAGRLVGTRVLEGVDAWSADVAPGTVFAEAGGTAVCALEPDGRYRKFALTTGKVLADRKLNLAAPPVKLIVVPGIERDLVIARATLVPRFTEEKIAQQHYLRREKVLGKLFGIPANGDKPVWEHAAKDFDLDLYQSPDLPFVALSRWGHSPAGEGQPVTAFSQLVLIDARTGTVFFDEEDRAEILTSSRMIALLGKSTILLPSSRTQFVLEYEREKSKGDKVKDEKATEKKE
jgi:outer membrane protein assembly factor BamB